MAFNSLNDHLVELSQLKSRNPSELPSLCLNTTKLATSLVIIQEEEGAQMSIYYINYVLTRAKLWYPRWWESWANLFPSTYSASDYKSATWIDLVQPTMSSRLFKWMIELDKFGLLYSPRIMIKAQALEGFIVELIPPTQLMNLLTWP